MRFADAVGRRLIETGQYNLTFNGTGYIIDPAKWSNFVRAGVTIEMSIILTPGGYEERQRCPRCRAKDSNLLVDSWKEW